MALTRKFLKGMGLTDEQIESIIDNHSETVSGLKDEIDKLKEEAGKLSDVQKELDGLKKGKDWKGEHDKVLKQLEDLKKEIAGKEQSEKLWDAYRELLNAEKIDPKRHAAIRRVTDLSGMKLDKDGKLENAEAIQAKIKEDWGDFATTTESKGTPAATPPASAGSGKTRDEIMAMKDTAQRQRAIAENHELFGF